MSLARPTLGKAVQDSHNFIEFIRIHSSHSSALFDNGRLANDSLGPLDTIFPGSSLVRENFLSCSLTLGRFLQSGTDGAGGFVDIL